MMEQQVLNQVLLQPACRIGADYETWMWNIGGGGLEAALKAPESIIAMMKAADLRGLGGSGFATWFKWEAVAKHSGKKYLICNGNEDEPGTFKDRVLMEECPHQLVEGATITAIACGINNIVFYINPHLTAAISAVRLAVEQWQKSEWLGRLTEKTGLQID